MKWFRNAAEQGTDRAQFNLGVMYSKGLGVKQNNVYAHMWSKIAASNGNKNAVRVMENIMQRMSPAELSEARKLAKECIRKNYIGC